MRSTLHFLSVCCLLLAGTAAAQSGNDMVRPDLIADVEAAAPGSTFHVAVRMKIAPHWHTYWINPGESGAPTTIKLTGPKGFTFGEIQWPTPTKFVIDGGTIYGYEDEVLLRVPVSVAKDAAAGSATIHADVDWLVCKDTCLEGSAKLSLKLNVADKAAPANTELFAKWQSRLTVPRQDPKASVVDGIAQPRDGDGQPLPQLKILWEKMPAKVEWFPVATAAVAIEEIQLKNDGKSTEISFKPKVFDAAAVPGGKVDGVLVWTDDKGDRIAVPAPVTVSLKK